MREITRDMATDTGSIHQSLAPQSPASLSPCDSTSTQPQRELARRPAVLPIPASRAFAEGFCGGLTGGVVYCVVLACFQIDRLDLACLRALALSLVFGGFEMWRILRGRTFKSAGTCLLCTLAVSMLVLWGLGAALAGTERTRHEAPRPSNHSRLALIT